MLHSIILLDSVDANDVCGDEIETGYVANDNKGTFFLMNDVWSMSCLLLS